MSNLTPQQAAAILRVMQEVAPVHFFDGLDDHNAREMQEYATFSEALAAIIALLEATDTELKTLRHWKQAWMPVVNEWSSRQKPPKSEEA